MLLVLVVESLYTFILALWLFLTHCLLKPAVVIISRAKLCIILCLYQIDYLMHYGVLAV